jgi:hypothetical protein
MTAFLHLSLSLFDFVFRRLVSSSYGSCSPQTCMYSSSARFLCGGTYVLHYVLTPTRITH